jgi:Eukaryotic aspartyl protease
MKTVFLTALASASLISSISALTLAPRSASPRVVQLSTTRKAVHPVEHDRRRLRRRDGTVTVTLDNEETLYFADCTLGTPAQSLRLHIDTGSSDLWVNTANSTFCESARDACSGGTYDPSSSSTYKFVNSDFNISYVDGTGATGDYVSDTLTIGSISLTDFQFGVGFESSSEEGVLGIGYVTNEVQVNRADGLSYPNLPQAMAQTGLITTNAYSLWLNDLDANTGSILFGGVNKDKYTGDLATVPIIKEYNAYYEFIIALTGVSINDGSSSTSFDSSTSLPTAALLDSGSSLVYLPNDVTEDIYNSVGATYDSQSGVAYVDCSLANNASTLDFDFSGQIIQVPYNELVLDVGSSDGGQLTFQNGDAACVFGIAPAQGSEPVLGDTFLRSAYVVYDLDSNEISLAQTNFNSTTDDVVEITKASGVPGATDVASPVTTVSAETGGARIGSPTTTSSPDVANAASAELVSVGLMGAALGAVGVFFAFF